MSKETKKQPKAEEDPELAKKKQAEAEDEEEDEEEEGETEEEEEDEEDEEEDEEDEEDEAEDETAKHQGKDAAAHADDEDPYWWTPHVVLAVLVLVGILGFFGMFNKPLGFLAAKPQAAPTTETAATQPATQNTPATPPRPMPPAQQQPQQQREMFGAKHFLVMYKGGMRAPANVTRTKEEAKARAEEGLKKVKAGAKFETIVAEYSDEPNAGARGGDLGLFPKGAMVAPFQEAVEKLKVNEISGLVETPFGYHVIMRTK
jgi:parvulin-like peptidyl-prolyl isomerase